MSASNKKKKMADPVERFFKKNVDFSMFASTFDAICGTDFAERFPHDDPYDITPLVFFAYKELQDVWRDVLEHLQDPSYTCTHIQVIETEVYKENPVDRMCTPGSISKPKCSFMYRGVAFTVKFSILRGWTIKQQHTEDE
jgi:hypothetical protein